MGEVKRKALVGVYFIDIEAGTIGKRPTSWPAMDVDTISRQ
jgi:hypothetical protein